MATVSVDLGSAIRATNELLGGRQPEQRAASLIALSLLLSAIFFAISHFDGASGGFYWQSTLLQTIVTQLGLSGPPQLWLLVEALLFFLGALACVKLIVWSFKTKSDTDPRTDALTPVREELVKVPRWDLELRNFNAMPASNKVARVRMTMNEKFKKLSVEFEISDGLEVKGYADDVSLQVVGGNEVSLMFFISKLANAAGGKTEDFEYLITAKGVQDGSDKTIKFDGAWYRLSETKPSYGMRGPCHLVSVLQT